MAENEFVPVDEKQYDEALRKFHEARQHLVELGEGRTVPPPFGCSFCLRDRVEIEMCVAGRGVAICEKCIALCHELMEERQKGA